MSPRAPVSTCIRAAIMGLTALVGTGVHAAPADLWTTSEFRTEQEATGRVPGEPSPTPVPARADEHRGPSPGVRRVMTGRYLAGTARPGELAGKVVYVSPGHGWTYGAPEGWLTQRPNTHGVVEDMGNADGVAQFLVPYLLGAGAEVVAVRELDPNPKMVIVDNADGPGNPDAGRYVESGDATRFSASTTPAFGHPPLPLSGAVNPFTLGSDRLMKAATSETARATFVPNVPEPGHYYLYIAYTMGPDRPSDAHVTVVHPGGRRTFLVDQRRHGGTWVLLGRFYFDAGTNAERGAVIVTNQSQEPGTSVSLDAVRIGGGTGLIDRGGGTSNAPRADECSRYHAQFAGAPASVYDASSGADRTDDVGTRSRFADWVHAPGEEAVYVSLHSNAANGAARGTQTYVYGKNAPDGSMQPTANVIALGSVDLAKAVHQSVIDDLRQAVDSDWRDKGLLSAYFGELNPSHQDEMPSILLEAAFHDQANDAAALKDPGFRGIFARAVYKGIARYFAARDGRQATILPEPPHALVARNTGDRTVTLAWRAPASGGALGDPARGYRVYRSKDGRSFDDGTDTAGATELRLSGLTAGDVLYLRVTATNAGGESLPSRVVAVSVAAGAEVPVLLVGGFRRLDAGLNVRRSYPGLDTVDRLLLDRINDGTYLAEHGAALAASGVAFDSCLDDAVEAGDVALDGYRLLLWQTGRGDSASRALSKAASSALVQAAAAGVSIMLSGEQLARSLTAGDATDQQLLAALHATVDGEPQAQQRVEASGWGPLVGLEAATLPAPDGLPYDPGTPDAIAALPGATAIARYGDGRAAAVLHKDDTGCAAILGFPLEALRPPERQAALVTRLLAYCGIETPDPVETPDGGSTPPAHPPGWTDGDGCSCNTTHTPAAGAWLLIALCALVTFFARRRRRDAPGAHG